MDVAAEESQRTETIIAVRQAWTGTRPSELRRGSLFFSSPSTLQAAHLKTNTIRTNTKIQVFKKEEYQKELE